MSPIENRPFDALQVGEEDRLVHTLTSEDFSLLATQAATIGAGLVDPTVAATRAFGVDAAQSGWASALMSALIAGRLPGAGSKLVRQTIETTTPARPGDVMTIVAKVMSKTPEGRRVTIGVRATNQHGDLAMSGTAEIVAPKKAIVAEPREEFVQEMHEKGRRYKQLIEVTRNMKPLKTAVVHPVDEASLMGAVEASREDLIEPVLVGPEKKDPPGRRGAQHRHRRLSDCLDRAQPRRRRQSGGDGAIGRGRSADEGGAAYGRTDARGRRNGYGPAHLSAHQPCVRDRRARLPAAAVHHRRRRQYLSGPDRQARHRSERHRPRDRSWNRHAARGDPLRGRDGLARYPLDDRRGRALQDGRSRPDRGRHPRWAARLRQRGVGRSRADEGDRVAGRRPGRHSCRTRTSKPATCWPNSSSIWRTRRWPGSCSARACRSS